MLVDFDVRGQQGMDFITGGSIVMDYGLIFCPEVTVQNALIMYIFVTNIQLFASQDWWTEVMWIT